MALQGGPIQILKPKFKNFALSVHYYNQNDSLVESAIRKFAAQADAWNVPLFVGEFAFAAVLDKFINILMVRDVVDTTCQTIPERAKWRL